MLQQRPRFLYENLGVVSYGEALELQTSYHERCVRGELDGVILALEHKPVITLGKHATEKDVFPSQEFLKQKGVDFFRTDRGGQVTCHMPGQLVLYPIISLEKLSLGVRPYVRALEDSCLDLLREYDVQGEVKDDSPGIWISGKKIASVGVRVKERVTLHGLALNISNHLDLFTWVSPCGMPRCSMTRLDRETQKPLDMKELMETLARKIVDSLGAQISFQRIGEKLRAL